MGNTQQKLDQSQQDEKSEEPQVPDSDFTCEICIEPLGSNKKFKNKCNHDFCSDCIAKYIESKILEFNVANIDCPALNCKLLLDPLSCRPIISTHLFCKWCDLLCNATALQNYSKSFVYCPYRDCSALIVNECNDKLMKCICPNCKNIFCFRCKRAWHAGYRCREIGKFGDPNDVLAGQLIEEKKWTRCRKCGNAVERNGGCRLIRCRCGNMFCHACGKTNELGLRLCCKQSRQEQAFILISVLLVVLVAWLLLAKKISISIILLLLET